MGHASLSDKLSKIGHRALVATLLATTAILTGTGMPVPPAMAQVGQVNEFNIPAGPLNRALATFGAQSGTQLSYEASIASGMASPGVRGTFSREAALNQILQGSGLVYSFAGSRNVVIARPDRNAGRVAPDGSIMLDTVVIRANAGTTEGTGSYTTGAMNTATPLDLSIRETPQSVSVVTRQRLEDNASVTVEEALNLSTGVTITANGSARNKIYSRGSEVGSLMIDGVSTVADVDVMGSSTLAMYDRIEVVRGATGFMEGSGNPSGSVNLARKRPTDRFQGSISGSVGSWDNFLGVLDIGGPLNAGGTIRGRTVISAQDVDSFTMGSSYERRLVYGILEADLTENTTLTFGGYYNREDNPGAEWTGLPTREDGSFYDFDRSARSSPLWSYWNKENRAAFAELEHRLDNDWNVTLKSLYMTSKMDMLGSSTWWRDSNDTIGYSVGKYAYEHEQKSLDFKARGPVEFFGREHEISIGANYKRLTSDDGPGGWPVSFPYRFDPSDWEASVDAPLPDFTLPWSYDGDTIEYGISAIGRINVSDPLNVFVGGRLSWYDTETAYRSGEWSNPQSFSVDGHFTPYLAATYDVDSNHTVYGSYTGIFNGQNYISDSGSILNPVEGKNYEVGVKGEYLDGRLNASLALFQINQRNLPESLPQSSCSTIVACYAPSGEVRSRGGELELSGHITDNWRLFGGYTFLNGKYLEDSENGNAGAPYGTTTPRHLFTLSTVYSLSGKYEGWRVGASAKIQSDTFLTISGYSAVRQPSYGIANFMAGYSPNEDLDIQLNVSNIFDKKYYRAVGYPDGDNLFGEPRNFVLSAKYKF